MLPSGEVRQISSLLVGARLPCILVSCYYWHAAATMSRAMTPMPIVLLIDGLLAYCWPRVQASALSRILSMLADVEPISTARSSAMARPMARKDFWRLYLTVSNMPELYSSQCKKQD